MSRLFTFSVFSSLLLFYANFALAADAASYSYICSDGNVYTVRVNSPRPDGFDARGPWHEFKSFCNASITSGQECASDISRSTSKCFYEFRMKGNLRLVGGAPAVWPDKIRHAPSASWLEHVRLSPEQSRKICGPALYALNCVKPFADVAHGENLKCLYDRSGFANRASGRNCFQAISTKLGEIAQSQRRQLASGQRKLAGR